MRVGYTMATSVSIHLIDVQTSRQASLYVNQMYWNACSHGVTNMHPSKPIM